MSGKEQMEAQITELLSKEISEYADAIPDSLTAAVATITLMGADGKIVTRKSPVFLVSARQMPGVVSSYCKATLNRIRPETAGGVSVTPAFDRRLAETEEEDEGGE